MVATSASGLTHSWEDAYFNPSTTANYNQVIVCIIKPKSQIQPPDQIYEFWKVIVMYIIRSNVPDEEKSLEKGARDDGILPEVEILSALAVEEAHSLIAIVEHKSWRTS